jgi:hypothetical protein
MRWEQVPPLALFEKNTAASSTTSRRIRFQTSPAMATTCRVQVLTPTGVLDRDKRLGVVKELTDIIAVAAGDATVAEAPGCSSSSPPKAVGVIAAVATSAAPRPVQARVAPRSASQSFPCEPGRGPERDPPDGDEAQERLLDRDAQDVRRRDHAAIS